MNENMEILNVSNVKPIIDTIEPQEIVDINEEEWNKDAVVNMTTMTQEKEEENYDLFFDNLSTDVEGASTLISEILEKKRSIKDNEENITKERETFNLEKQEFEKYKNTQIENLDLEKRRFAECVKLQKIKFQEEEAQIKADADVMHKELTLKEQAVKIDQKKLQIDRDQFDKYREVEENKISHEKEKLEIDKQQLAKDKELSLQKLENERKELEAEKEQFEKFKEVEEKRISLEKANLNQRCERFKKIVQQFNKNFAKLPEE